MHLELKLVFDGDAVVSQPVAASRVYERAVSFIIHMVDDEASHMIEINYCLFGIASATRITPSFVMLSQTGKRIQVPSLNTVRFVNLSTSVLAALWYSSKNHDTIYIKTNRSQNTTDSLNSQQFS